MRPYLPILRPYFTKISGDLYYEPEIVLQRIESLRTEPVERFETNTTTWEPHDYSCQPVRPAIDYDRIYRS